MSNNKLEKWNSAYAQADISTAEAAMVLRDNHFLLGDGGTALDLACGRAGNAIFLANRGYQVDAIDLSPVVLEHVAHYSEKQGLSIKCMCRDIENEGLPGKQYDVIVVSYFLNRQLFPAILDSIKPNGLLFYQTWSQLRIDESGPSNPDFRLQPGELLSLCAPLRPLYYRENGLQGDIGQGLRNEAQIIAQKIT